MMVRVVSVMASTRCSTRRATKMPPAIPSTRTISQRPAPGRRHDVEQPLALVEIAPDQQTKAARQFHDPHQGVMLGGVLVVEPPVDGLDPA